MFRKLKSALKSATMFSRLNKINSKLDKLCEDVINYKQTVLSLKPSKLEATYMYDVSKYLYNLLFTRNGVGWGGVGRAGLSHRIIRFV